MAQFDRDYQRLTAQVRDTGEPFDLGEAYMVIGTSALAQYDIGGAVSGGDTGRNQFIERW